MNNFKQQQGFAAVEAILVVIVLGIIGFTGWFVYHSKQATDKTLASTGNSTDSQVAKKTPAGQSSSPTQNKPTANPNDGYLVVKEWSLRFKVPTALSDVQYRVLSNTKAGEDDKVAFYAKPSGQNVSYISNYDATDNTGYPTHALGILYRSTQASETKMGDEKVQGKKIGNYYYYTAWAFNSMASGAGCVGLYGDSDAACQVEATAFQLVNQGDTALLNTIQQAQ